MLWFGEYNRKLDIKLQEMARMKLRMMNSAQDLNDLKIPPSNHLKKTTWRSTRALQYQSE